MASVKECMAEKGVFDLLVNCAGVARFEKIMETTKAAFDFQIGVNYRAVALLSDVRLLSAKEMMPWHMRGWWSHALQPTDALLRQHYVRCDPPSLACVVYYCALGAGTTRTDAFFSAILCHVIPLASES